jgi:hypothetical protein
MKKAHVLFDRIGWATGKGEDREYHMANRGDEVELDDKEFARQKELGSIGTKEEAAKAAGAAIAPPAVSDEQLRSMTVDEVTAYLNQHPEEVDRIEAAELERDNPRKGVTDLVDAHREATGA